MAEAQKTALITGGNTGIGLAVAHELGALGLQVIISARSQDKADKALADLKSNVWDKCHNKTFPLIWWPESISIIVKFGYCSSGG